MTKIDQKQHGRSLLASRLPGTGSRLKSLPMAAISPRCINKPRRLDTRMPSCNVFPSLAHLSAVYEVLLSTCCDRLTGTGCAKCHAASQLDVFFPQATRLRMTVSLTFTHLTFHLSRSSANTYESRHGHGRRPAWSGLGLRLSCGRVACIGAMQKE